MTAIFQLPRAFPLVGDVVLSSGITVPRALPGAKLEFYLANTSTPADVYTNASRATKHTWPVVADSTGRFAPIYLGQGLDYDITLKDTTGATIYTAEDIAGDPADAGASTTYLGRTVEVGAMMFHSLGEVPAGWLRIKKLPQALLKSQYPELNSKYLAQSYPYGSDSTTFNIPGGAGLFLRGWDDVSTWDPDFATRKDHLTGTTTTVGNIIGSRQANQNKTHTHGPGSLATNTTGAHTHTVPVADTTINGENGSVRKTVSTNNTTTSSNGDHSHTVNSGVTAADGGTESRPDNAAFPIIILVNPAAAAAVHSTLGLPYTFSVDTADTDPSTGHLKFNNAAASLATNIYASKTDVFGSSVANLWAALDLIGGTARGVITIYNAGAMSNSVTGVVNGALVDGGAYWKIPIDVKSANGTIANDAKLAVQFALSGQPGSTGATGPNTGLDYAWDTGTTDADPGNGELRGNNATLASITQIYISKTGRNAESLGTHIDGWDSSTNVADKGSLRIFQVSDRTRFIEAIITGALVDGATYWKVPVSIQASGATPIAAAVMAVMFSKTGNAASKPVITEFTSSGTYNKTSGAQIAHIRGVGGGASGGGVSGATSQTAAASGGSAGGEFDFWLDLAAVTSETITIGAGGAAPTAGANNGNPGGATSFGAYATANGGLGGQAMATGTALAVAAAVAGGTTTGLGGKNGAPSSPGIRLSGTVAVSGNGASSRYGAGGVGLTAAADGTAGTGYGSGSAGAMTASAVNRTSTAAPGGRVIIEEYF